MAPVRALPAAAALLLLAGCSLASRSAELPTAAAGPAAVVPCVETTASTSADRPPLLAGTTSSWFGRDDLWVGLPDYPPTAEGSELVLRFPWVSLDDDKPTSELGAPAVAATRRDGPGGVVAEVGAYTRSFGTAGLEFWPTTVRFPGPGCWTVTGTLARTSVEFVVDVQPP